MFAGPERDQELALVATELAEDVDLTLVDEVDPVANERFTLTVVRVLSIVGSRLRFTHDQGYSRG